MCKHNASGLLWKNWKRNPLIQFPNCNKPLFFNVKLASGRTAKVLAQVDVKFKVKDHNFQDSFLKVSSMNSVVLGNRFFKKYNIEISPGENLLKLSELTYQLNEIRIPKEERRKIPKCRYPVFFLPKNNCQAPKLRNLLHKNRIFEKFWRTRRNDKSTWRIWK